MTTTKLSTKGQLIIPKEMRDHRGWRAGTMIEVEEAGDAVILRAAGTIPRTKLKDVLGCLRYRGKTKTIEEMDAAIAAAAAESR